MDSYQTETNKKSKDKQSVTSSTDTQNMNDSKDDTISGLGHDIKRIGFGQYSKR